jgi:hypothetical protein
MSLLLNNGFQQWYLLFYNSRLLCGPVMAAKHNPLLSKDNWSSVCIHFRNFNLPSFWKGWCYRTKNYGIKFIINDITCLLNFMKTRKLVQRLWGGGVHTDEQRHCWFQKPPVNFVPIVLQTMLSGSTVTGMARPRVADRGDGLQIWRVAAHILNKQSRTADSGWSSSQEVGRRANNPTP